MKAETRIEEKTRSVKKRVTVAEREKEVHSHGTYDLRLLQIVRDRGSLILCGMYRSVAE